MGQRLVVLGIIHGAYKASGFSVGQADTWG